MVRRLIILALMFAAAVKFTGRNLSSSVVAQSTTILITRNVAKEQSLSLLKNIVLN